MAKAKIFNSIQVKAPKRNRFDLSYTNTMSCNMGKLVPFMVQDVIPGDKLKVSCEHLLKLMPLSTPMLQRMNVYMHYFFVPYRIIWNDFEKFITGGADGLAQPSYPVLNVPTATLKTGSLCDYLGFPSDVKSVATHHELDALPFRAYNLIYNNYYRDQNFEPSIPVPLGSGNDMTWVNDDGDNVVASVQDMTTLRDRPYPKDYFTSALPFLQRGPAAKIPISAELTIPAGSIANGKNPLDVTNPQVYDVQSPVLHSGLYNGGGDGERQNIQARDMGNNDGSQLGLQLNGLDVPSHDVTLQATQADGTIAELRRAFALQEFLEKSARGGARYIEQQLSFFGVRGSDYRLQRPLYLGGSKSPIVISELLQTSAENVDANDESTPLGTQSGQGNSLGGSFMFNRFFEEHGLVIGILSIMPKASYFQGMPRRYMRRDKFDFYWPQFAHIGEQAILTNEIFYNGSVQSISDPQNTDPDNPNVFGYTPRYAEYRFNHDEIHGQFRTSLNRWHMARDFQQVPNLNADFIHVDQSQSQYRPFTIDDPADDHFRIQIYNGIKASRLIPQYGTPSI